MIDGTVLQTFGTLMILSLLLGGGILFLKKFSKNTKSKNNLIDIKIISKINIQPKTSIIVVSAGLKTLLIGTTDHNISILADLTEDVKNINRNNSKPMIKEIPNDRNLVSSEEIRRAMLMQKNQMNSPSLSFGTFLKSTFSRA